MINVNELSVGNLVCYDENPAVWFEVGNIISFPSKTIEAIDGGDVMRRAYKADIQLFSTAFQESCVSGIEITPEILGRLGFKNFYTESGGYEMSIKNIGEASIDILPQSDFWGLLFSCKSSTGGFTIGVNYVHELQNLVYSFTKQNLTLDSTGGEL